VNGRPNVSARICEDALPEETILTRDVKIDGRPIVPLGGDYWHIAHRTHRGIGAAGRCWIRTTGTDVMLSPAFRASSAFVGLRARGGGRIELRDASGNVLDKRDVQPGAAMINLVLDASRAAGPVRVALVPSSSLEVDDIRLYASANQAVAIRESPFGTRAFGFADVHVHLMAHQSAGGLQGNVHTLWGVPGGDVDRYRNNPDLVWKDIPRCDGYNHRGRAPLKQGWEGFLGGALVNGMSGKSPAGASPNDLIQFFLHDRGDAGVKRQNGFKDSFHQQHHITALRRAYEGGMRLMSALVVESEFLELIMNKVDTAGGRPSVQLTKEIDLIRAGVCFARRLTELNSSWMEIAYTPADAQRIMASNKLALILGIELPDVGNLGFGSPEQEVEELYRLGIRQSVIVHGANTKLAGTSLFQDVYDWFNDLMATGRTNDRVSRTYAEAVATEGTFLKPMDGGCGNVGQGECVAWKLGKLGLRPVVTKIADAGVDYFPLIFAASALAPGLGGPSPELTTVLTTLAPVLPPLYGLLLTLPPMQTPVGIVAPPRWLLPTKIAGYQAYGQATGHMNTMGLTAQGKAYVRELMKRGMLIDLAHASDHTVRDVLLVSRELAGSERCGAQRLVLDPAWPTLTDKDPGNKNSELAKVVKSFDDEARTGPAECFDNAYPLLYSHAQFRAQSFQRVRKPSEKIPNATKDQDLAAREFEMADHQVRWFERLGGTIGVFMGQDTIVPPKNQEAIPVANDCANSTSSFAWGYAYGAQLMTRNGVARGVALASDAGFHPMAGPRFGPDACNGAARTDRDDDTKLEQSLNAQFYKPAAQKNGVRYQGIAATEKTGNNPPLAPYRMGSVVFDYNVEGWANYGIVPDLLQDARNVGMDADRVRPIFASAQDFVDTWAKAHWVSGCEAQGGKCADWTAPAPLDCDAACKGTCPSAQGTGAPPEGEAYDIHGILTNDPMADAVAAVCLAKPLQVQTPREPAEHCHAALGACVVDRTCQQRTNDCAGILGARVWNRCEDDPDKPLTDAFSGPEIRIGACYAMKGLDCNSINLGACSAGFHKVGTLCSETCKPGWLDLGVTCNRGGEVIARPSRERGIGTPEILQCDPGKDLIAGLCYAPCRPGFRAVGPTCWEDCPQGFHDDGLVCRKPGDIQGKATYGRGAGYALWDEAKCKKEHPDTGCEKSGLIWYPKCKPDFEAFGCCICRHKGCPAGYHDDGGTCRLDPHIIGKQSYDRVSGARLTCGGSKHAEAGLCYEACRPGETGIANKCWGPCPAGFHNDGLTCRKTLEIVAKKAPYIPQFSAVGSDVNMGATTLARKTCDEVKHAKTATCR
jgi:microsomal dipeptidase-like Zn-dependent dipeptidase